MTDKCDALKVLGKLETIIDIKYYSNDGRIEYQEMKQIIANLMREIQTENDTSVNELKKEFGIYHNDDT